MAPTFETRTDGSTSTPGPSGGSVETATSSRQPRSGVIGPDDGDVPQRRPATERDATPATRDTEDGRSTKRQPAAPQVISWSIFNAALATALVINVPSILYEAWLTSPWGSAEVHDYLRGVTLIPYWIAIALYIVLPFGLLIGENGPRFRFLAFVPLCVASCFASMWISDTIRHTAFARLAQTSDPLIAAIQTYVEVHGEPPRTLDDMVPSILPALPHTGMGAYPEYEYRVGASKHSPTESWTLVVRTPRELWNADEFVYYPSARYPKRDASGWFEPIGAWAYYHE